MGTRRIAAATPRKRRATRRAAARAVMLAGALKVGQARATRRRRKAVAAMPAIETKATKPQRRARAR